MHFFYGGKQPVAHSQRYLPIVREVYRWFARELPSLRRFEITQFTSVNRDTSCLMFEHPRNAFPQILVAGYFCLGLVPFVGSWVSPTLLNLWIALCGLLAAAAGSRDFPHLSENKHVLWALLGFASSLLLSSYFSKLPHDSLEFLIGVLPGALLCLLFASALDPKWFALSITFALFFALLVLTVTCLHIVLMDNHPLDYGTFLSLDVALLQVPNDILLFAVFWPVVCWSISSGERLSQKQKGLVGWSYLGLLVTLSVLLGSRSTFLLTVCCAVSWLHAGPKPVGSTFLLILAAAGSLLVFVSPAFIESLLALPSSSQRLWIWLVSIQMMDPADYFIGVGHGLFGRTFEAARSYIETPAGLLSDPRRMGWAHNLFIETWVERGFAGLLSLIWINWALLMRLLMTDLKAPYPRALFGLFILLLVTSCFELTLIRPWVCATLGVFIGLVLGLPDSRPRTGGP